jgi:hypothetical protein
MYYVVCWTEDDGIYGCEHKHGTIAEAMWCMVPGGGTFIRAVEGGRSRSLNEAEWVEFLIALKSMPWANGG